jgi:MFS family permease
VSAASGTGFLRALNHKSFRRFFEGQAISLIGTWVQNTALAWLVWRTTRSATHLAVITFASQIPNLLLAPLAGVFADRYSRLRMVMVTQVLLMLQALGLAAAVLSGYDDFRILVAFALMLGSVVAFDIPARQSLVIELAGKADLANAIALNSLLFNGARAIGPAMAGALLVYFSEGWFFLANGLSYILAIALIASIRIPARRITMRAGNVMQNVGEALRFVRRHTALRDTLLNVSFISLFGIPHIVILPAVAEHALGATTARGYSTLMSASGAGAVIGAFLLARGSVDGRSARTIPLAGLAFAVALLLFSFSSWLPLSALLLVPAGVTLMAQTVGTNTFIQSLVPDRFRGRVMSFYTMMFLGILPLGSLLMGALADRIGPLGAIRLGACVVLGGALLLLSRLRRTETSMSELLQLEADEAAQAAAESQPSG